MKNRAIKIGFFGDGPWAHESFNRLITYEFVQISFVTVRWLNRDQTLMNLADKFGVPVELTENVNSDDFFDRIKKYGVDLFVAMSFDQIFRTRMIDYPRLKTINCHAGKLPFYRGRNILNWALINDEKEFGITVHYINEGIDTGDIILQDIYPITDEDDYGTLLRCAYSGCADALCKSIRKIYEGSVERIKQDSIDPIGSYCGMRQAGDELIDWNQSSRRIFNFVRAIAKPGPMATSILNDKRIRINKVREVKGVREYIGIPGQIIGKTDEGYYVKTKDTFVEMIEFEYDGRIRVGSRLGRPSENLP